MCLISTFRVPRRSKSGWRKQDSVVKRIICINLGKKSTFQNLHALFVNITCVEGHNYFLGPTTCKQHSSSQQILRLFQMESICRRQIKCESNDEILQ